MDIRINVGRVIYITISAFAEMERKCILQRCNEGWERSLEEGRHLEGFLISSFNNAFKSLLNKG
ncbi:hypothetical protein VCHA43P277_160097 [Vibrio chagasii]|nr:hypothetical protein VCHA34P126_140078 [Vibrio chagasii]CAH6986693.1 hypothetical protein VCHA43P277_160097 [Vibrio chagasii]CAH7034560.1 hypothetical protein VCHA41O247_160098 [Vibrio chagasii]CAH7243237.1 hypothetical protein VCHA50P420_160051 [Vibrio chagasii]